MPEWKYSVLLSRHLDPRDLAFFEHFGGRIVSEDGSFLPHLFCTEVDASHHVYLFVSTFKPSEGVIIKMRIPHSMVFFISDPIEEGRPIGFI